MDLILASPGLSFLASDILNHVDLLTFSKLELVCKSWRRHIIADKLWKHRLLAEVAPAQSPARFQVERKKFSEILESKDLHRISCYCRRICYRLHHGFREHWLDPRKEPEIIGLPGTGFIRDMKVDADKIVYAIENDIFVLSRSQEL